MSILCVSAWDSFGCMTVPLRLLPQRQYFQCITVYVRVIYNIGYLLAVPLTVFLLDYCIRYPSETMTDVAARELESVSVDFGDL